MRDGGARRPPPAVVGFALVSLIGALVVVTASPALAAVSCTFDAGTHVDTVTSTSSSITIVRNGSYVDVSGTDCGTVTTVDTVNIDLGAINSAFLTFDLGGGVFAPGFTDEGNGSSEIEFAVTNLGSGTRVSVEGTSGPDSFAVGQRTVLVPTYEVLSLINLNAAQDGSSPDVDVVTHGLPGQIGLSGDAGDDVLTGAGTGTPLSHATTVPMVLNDGPGADQVTGGSGSDIIGPNDGPDPGDTFSGGGGYDFIDYEGSSQGVSVSLDDKANDGTGCPGPGCDHDNVMADIESVRGTVFDDTLTGGPGPQSLEGLGGTNVLSGGGGDDFLYGGSGQDTFHGGGGTDSVSYYAATGDVNVTLDGVANDGAAGEHDNVESDVENVAGGPGNDHLEGNANDNQFWGDAGDDVLNGGGGNDTLDGGGGGGSDVFIGGPGDDTAVETSVSGDQTLSIDGKANDQVVGDPSQGIDNIHTDVENVTGGSGNDTITGDKRSNTLSGGYGNDTLVGGAGNDTLQPGAGTDTLSGGSGKDMASYADSTAPVTVDLLAQTATGDGSDTLSSIEMVEGSPFADHVDGSNSANRLVGGAGDDTIGGAGGDDVLLGDQGNDTLDGGAGSDVCKQGPGKGKVTHCEA